MLPSTELKTHVVTFKGSDNGIYITEQMAKLLSVFRNDPNAVSFPLVDRVTGRLIKDIGKFEIKSIDEIKKDERSGSYAGSRWICRYGVRHFMHEHDCSCNEIYRCKEMGVIWPFQFTEWCIRRFPKASIYYDGDITDQMREEFLKEKSLIQQI